MKFAFSAAPVVDLACDLLAVPVYEDSLREGDFAAIDGKLGGLPGKLIDEERFEGKKGQSLSVHKHGKLAAARVLLHRLGKEAAFDTADLPQFAARTVRAGKRLGGKDIALSLAAGTHGQRVLQPLGDVPRPRT